jgi:hypothetical protein
MPGKDGPECAELVPAKSSGAGRDKIGPRRLESKFLVISSQFL